LQIPFNQLNVESLPNALGNPELLSIRRFPRLSPLCRIFIDMSSLSSHLAHLHNTLPMAVLVTELVSHQEGQFAVRAIISVGNQPLVTGLAAHPNIEVAEDRAQERALQKFADWVPRAGMGMTNAPIGNIAPLPPAPFFPPATAPTPTAKPPSLDADLPPTNFSQPVAFTGGMAPSTSADASTGAIADLYSHISSAAPPENTPPEEPAGVDAPPAEAPPKSEPPRKKTTAASSSKKGSRKSAEPSPPLVPESVDLSDVIAQTDIELRRLNWTNLQGREYLEQTYDKRSRQELSELELYEFLSYLEEQPTPQSAG
jgi:hypothetical protein